MIEQSTVDRRHADNKSPQAEHVGFHSVLRSLSRADIPVAEIITDEHKVVIADMSENKMLILHFYFTKYQQFCSL